MPTYLLWRMPLLEHRPGPAMAANAMPVAWLHARLGLRSLGAYVVFILILCTKLYLSQCTEKM